MTAQHDRIPPHNLEAEMALLGSVLVDPEIMASIGVVRASDFYAHVHESLFEVLQTLFDRRAPLDRISVAEELRTRGMLEKVGGLSYLSTLMETVQTAASAQYYAKLVREKSVLRSLIHAGTQVAQLGYEAEDDVDGAVDAATTLVMQVATQDLASSTSAYDAALEVSRELINGLTPGLVTGFGGLDGITGGLHPGRVYLVGARPGVGKTSLQLAISRRVAGDGGRVLIASPEMTAKDLVQRLAAAESNVDLRQLSSATLTEGEKERVLRGLSKVSELPLWIDDLVGSIEGVVASARRHHVKSKLSLLVVDYIQLLGCENIRRDANMNERLSYVSRRLKTLAKELAIPVLVMSQLNRDVEKRMDKRPVLADLRESGSLEQDADVVIFIHREAMYDDDADPTIGELLVRKNRYGPSPCDVRVEWVGTCARYQNAGEAALAR